MLWSRRWNASKWTKKLKSWLLSWRFCKFPEEASSKWRWTPSSSVVCIGHEIIAGRWFGKSSVDDIHSTVRPLWEKFGWLATRRYPAAARPLMNEEEFDARIEKEVWSEEQEVGLINATSRVVRWRNNFRPNIYPPIFVIFLCLAPSQARSFNHTLGGSFHWKTPGLKSSYCKIWPI